MQISIKQYIHTYPHFPGSHIFLPQSSILCSLQFSQLYNIYFFFLFVIIPSLLLLLCRSYIFFPTMIVLYPFRTEQNTKKKIFKKKSTIEQKNPLWIQIIIENVLRYFSKLSCSSSAWIFED